MSIASCRHAAAVALVLAVMLFACAPALGEWEENGNPVCEAEDEQHSVTISGSPISYAYGQGERPRAYASIIAWADDRYWGVWESDICSQMMSADGEPLWDPEGVSICDAPGQQSAPVAVPDGEGGAVVVWRDRRLGGPGYAIYAQRIDEYGVTMWDEQGVEVCSETHNPTSVCVTADLSGGVIVAWRGDSDSGDYTEIQAQRIKGDMSEPWSTEYVVVYSDSTATPMFPDITDDGAGGAIIAWECNSGPELGVHAQRVDSLGVVMWTSGSTRICTGDGYDAAIVSDGAGGAIVAWEDYRTQEPFLMPDIHAQRLTANGGPRWQAGGIEVCTAFDRQDNPVLTTDDAGGAIVCWEDTRVGDDEDLYAARVDSGGTVLWPYEGVPISVAPNDQEEPRIIPDDAGGAIIVWRDWRGAAPFFAQRVDADGIPYWLPDGAPVCISAVDGLPEIAPDGESGAVVVWGDGRNVLEAGHDIFAKRLAYDYGDGMGVPEDSAQRLRIEQNSPNPFNPVTAIRCHVSEPGRVRLDVLDISGRVAATLVDRTWSGGPLDVEWRGLDNAGRQLASGVYLCRLRSGEDTATIKMVLLQ